MTRIGDIAGNLLAPDAPLLQVIERMDAVRRKLILVVDDDGQLLGTVSDGDIRRGLMRRLEMDAPVREVMNVTPVALKADGSDADALRRLADRGVSLAPVLDRQNRVVGLYPDVIGAPTTRDNLVVIMAGGRGVRLPPPDPDMPQADAEGGGATAAGNDHRAASGPGLLPLSPRGELSRRGD